MPDIGILGYALAALFFLILTLLLITSWRGRLQGKMLVIAAASSSLWAAAFAIQAAHHVLPLSWVWAAEALRTLVWLAFLTSLLGSVVDKTSAYARTLKYVKAALFLVCGLLVMPFEEYPLLSRLGDVHLQADARFMGQVVLAVSGMVLIEQFYRNTSVENRWGIKFLCLGLGAMFAFDFYLFSDALLFRRLDADIWYARGAINAIIVPLIALSAARNPQWSVDFSVSRKIVFHTTALFGTGLYMLLMATAGYYIRLYGGEWSIVLQVIFLFGAGLLLILMLFSGRLRAQVKVLLNKHFFHYQYDYREEWLRLTRMLSRQDMSVPLYERVIWGIGEIVESPGGTLWLCHKGQRCTIQAHWNLPSDTGIQVSDTGDLIQYLVRTQWVINLDEYEEIPELYEGLRLPTLLEASDWAWLIVPLIHNEELLGFVTLNRPRVHQALNWEITDLLKVAGKQTASYLAQFQAAEALAEAKQFEGFNRLSAFVVHDLKNLIAQLSLVTTNAVKHKHNPAFIDETIRTIENSVARMNRLMAQLRGAMSAGSADQVDLGEVLRQVISERSAQRPIPELQVGTESVSVNAEHDRIVSILGHVVQNAQEATGSQGEVRVRLRCDAHQAIVTVEDTGCGMDETFIRERLFKPFDSTKGLTGMGIGAYECREYVQSAGGEVRVTSKPGQGTTFSIHFPLAGMSVQADTLPEASTATVK
jgi:putative PEP-CTERM system histidine kinase